MIYEKNKKVSISEKLGFGNAGCPWPLEETNHIGTCTFLQDKKIATTYPVLVEKFLKEKNIQAEIHEISGSVEIAPGIGLADAIVDLVSSGSTLFMNGLKEVETILQSEAVLIRHPDLAFEQQLILEKLLFRIRSVRKARHTKYILLNAPNDRI